LDDCEEEVRILMLDTQNEKNRRPGLIAVGLATLLALALPSCKSSTSSSSTTDTTGTQARILVTNTYGKTLEIYMDSTLEFTLANAGTGTIKNVSIDTHAMEGKIPGGDIIDSTTIDVTSLIDYTYTIDRPDINVTNNFGEPLKIYYDNVYQFDLQDDENRWLINVTLASHFLKALKVSDSTEVASTTLDVVKNSDYAWTIQ